MSANTALPKGSLVLVTGVNGFIAAHVAQQFLQRGYKVRGTVRSLTKSAWLVQEAFQAEASSGSFELVAVEDMTKDDAFREAVRGVDAIIHLATIITLEPNPNNVVPTTVAGVLSLLRSASQQASVKQFVYTSSIGAAAMPLPNTPFHADANSWNDTAVSLAWAPEPYEPERAMVVYMASKVEAEKAFWKFIKEEKPAFRANAILPFTTFGPLLHAQQNLSSDAWLFGLYNGITAPLAALTACQYSKLHFPCSDIVWLQSLVGGCFSTRHGMLTAWNSRVCRRP